MLNLDTQTIGNRYHLIDKLGEGGMGAVYRAEDRLTGQNIALKRVTLTCHADEQISDFRYALAQEFKVLASLRHPHIISVLDYGFSHEGEPYFTLELLENSQSLVDYAQDKPLVKQVEHLIQILQALAYLHQRGINHRDLKPGNVMIVNDQVKVLDFGLAIARDRLNPESELVGTLFYMAPEIFSGTPVSVASDLYAFGIMMYELFTGSVPFQSSNNKYALMYKIARTPPDDTPLADSPLRDVILRLLQKQPSDRYASANEVIAALCETTGYPHPPESSAVRESFLQAARFVGREVEFDVLRDALNNARAGQGSGWLVAGESGVGKSRLLDELRTHALVEGALVLRGQAIAEGGLPYQIWRSAVRRLTLETDISDLAASVLKPLVPDIDRLLAREIPDMPQVDAQSLQVRLLSIIESLFRQPQLIVLLLEDLHWADESLILLKRLNELASDSALLIVGTYRDDERPGLLKELPALNHLKLERLSAASIEMLSESMLGEVGKSPMVVDLLARETEGNVFFIVEVVRALAEDAGQLADIGRLALPDHVFAGGMQTVIQRRLDKVPKSARRLMTSAAVAGRELDLQLLHALVPTLDLDDWLQDVTTVIEARGTHYRFAHDKLREGILLALPSDDRRQLHEEIAQTIETVYLDSPDQYPALAYHRGQARNAAKTIRNATLAGEQSLRSGSYRVAIQFFEQTLALTDQVALDNRQLSNLHYRIGNAYWGLSDF
ncbi:MAG: protein kinase, partial [Chloroflexota bacterium]